jgi:hypothetical protein
MEAEGEVMKGVVAIFICKQGHLIETSTDFDKGGSAGISQKENQKYRARDALIGKVVRAYSSSALSDNIENYTYKKIFEDLLKNGAKVHYEYIGYGDDE